MSDSVKTRADNWISQVRRAWVLVLGDWASFAHGRWSSSVCWEPVVSLLATNDEAARGLRDSRAVSFLASCMYEDSFSSNGLKLRVDGATKVVLLVHSIEGEDTFG